MIWVERVPWTFVRAKDRRHHRRGKWADIRAHVSWLYRSALDSLWAPILRDGPPLLDRLKVIESREVGVPWYVTIRAELPRDVTDADVDFVRGVPGTYVVT